MANYQGTPLLILLAHLMIKIITIRSGFKKSLTNLVKHTPDFQKSITIPFLFKRSLYQYFIHCFTQIAKNLCKCMCIYYIYEYIYVFNVSSSMKFSVTVFRDRLWGFIGILKSLPILSLIFGSTFNKVHFIEPDSRSHHTSSFLAAIYNHPLE